jgi:ubiquinone/menaquinone biosynthesis C-methylase UbiE
VRRRAQAWDRQQPRESPAIVTREDLKARDAYERGDLYDPKRICRKVEDEAPDFAGRMLADRIETVRQHYRGGRVLDLCCATGEHLLTLSTSVESGIGLDFSRRYIEAAKRLATERTIDNVDFVHGDGKAMPFKDGEFGLIYSFSSLYTIPKVQAVIGEVARVLRPGGIAVLDFGNRRSLNCYCLRYYDWPSIYPITPREMNYHLRHFGLSITRRRCYQLLPLWADKPRWLTPLLHPFWARTMSRRIRGRMLDEWLSSLPTVRQLAFRHVLVCERH